MSLHGSDGIYQKRLVGALIERTGTSPFTNGLATISEYQQLLADLDTGLHGAVTSEAAVKLYNERLTSCTASSSPKRTVSRHRSASLNRNPPRRTF